jgi:carbamoyl-phosphate synthase large subunit
MRSTGEVLGLADSFGLAFYKAQEAAKSKLPTKGTVLLTVSEVDRDDRIVRIARRLHELGIRILATQGTCAYLVERNIPCASILKVHEGRPNINDAITNGEIQLVVNTPSGKLGAHDDSYIRKAAIKFKVPYITTLAAAMAAVEGIEARRKGTEECRSLQEYHVGLKSANNR